MKQHLYYYPLAIVILAVFLGFLGWFTESSTLRWVASAFGLSLMAVALGLYSFFISLRTERRIAQMEENLNRIVSLQEDMHREQNEQASSGTSIVASLEAMSKYYMDYISKQKGEDDK